MKPSVSKNSHGPLTRYSLRASSPGRSGGGAGKGWRACNQVDTKYLLAEMTFSNDVITLGSCFSMFAYVRGRFRFELNGGNLTAQLTGSHRGIGGVIQTPET